MLVVWLCLLWFLLQTRSYRWRHCLLPSSYTYQANESHCLFYDAENKNLYSACGKHRDQEGSYACKDCDFVLNSGCKLLLITATNILWSLFTSSLVWRIQKRKRPKALVLSLWSLQQCNASQMCSRKISSASSEKALCMKVWLQLCRSLEMLTLV